jgi:hypothetical protein
MSLRDIINRTLCDWFHGGGHIKRDAEGRINWQCHHCGRWATPVDHESEAAIVRRDIAERLRSLPKFEERGR